MSLSGLCNEYIASLECIEFHRVCLVTVRLKLTAYKRSVNPYVSIQIEKKIEILYDLNF